MIDPVSPWAALACMLVALALAHALSDKQPADERGRFASVDGLRGFLATGVFLHHASIWYFYLQTGAWAVPPSRLYTQLGQTSVALFFMITAFLFIRKISSHRATPLDWRTLYLHRLFRLGPLYLFSIVVAFAFVFDESGWHLNESWSQLGQHALRWIVFTIGGMPQVNSENVGLITASVAWSLHYEWAFYLALPLLAWPLRRHASPMWLAVAVFGLSLLSVFIPERGIYFSAFAGGAVAVFAVQSERMRALSRSRAGSAIVIGGLFAMLFFDSAYQWIPLGILTIVFTVIACGCNVFGILVQPSVLFLGERAYSIYLLHPLLLFGALGWLIGTAKAAEASPLLYWSIMVLLTPILVLFSDATFRYIERPCIDYAAHRSRHASRHVAHTPA